MGLLEKLNFVVDNDFERLTYTEAIEILKETDNAIEAVEVEHEDDIYSNERNILDKK